MAKYQEKCRRCKKNYVMVAGRRAFALCYDCQKGDMQGTIKNQKIKKFFEIPEEYYKQNSLLRNIKIHYLRFGKLTEKQKEAFKKTVEKLEQGKN